MAIDIRTRTQEVVATIDTPAFLQQIEDSLPEGVSMQRFVSVTKTAVRTNPDLATADQTSLFGSIVRCAQDGLLPDGREAALVIYKGKVGYIPMIGGVRRIAAVYGWQIRTNVVYENDDFEYTDEPPEIFHRSVRPGMERGQLVAAYAVAIHRDGRRMQTVLHPADIAKRKSKAQTSKVWDEFPGPMWEKSAGHDIFGQLSLDPADARVDRILREGVLADPLAALYGGQGSSGVAEPSSETPDGGQGSDTQERQQAEDGGPGTDGNQSPSKPAPSAPGDNGDEEEAVWTVAPTDEEVEAAGQIVVPSGVHKDKTLAAVAADENGAAWFLTQLKKLGPDVPARAGIEVFVAARLPDVWDRYQAWKEEQS